MADRTRAQAHSDQVAARSRENYAAAAEIGPIPDVVNPARKESCRLDLYRFLQTYFPNSTGLYPFSEDHRRVIKRIETCILHGGRFVNAVFRGFAKTTTSENASIWAALYGHRRCVLLIGISKHASAENLESIKSELAENDLLFEDFPEVCHPIRELDGKPQRCKSQTCGGEHTKIRWRADGIILPTVAGSAASGAVIFTKPFSKARGAKFKIDGKGQRPDFAIIDDPQDEDSAATSGRVKKNLAHLKKGIAQSAGHGKSIAIVVNATVIAKNDLVEKLLADRAWQGERVSMVKQWANAHDSFWMTRYKEERQRYDPSDPDDQKRAEKRATDLYVANRAEADAGCIVSWEHCYDHEAEVSAIQHAYNALIDYGMEVFASEYQNDPIDESKKTAILTTEIVTAKTNRIDRGTLPRESTHLTLYCDVHDAILYWAALATWGEFNGHIVDYGTWPKQPKHYFDQASPPITLSDLYPAAAGKAAILAGLADLETELLVKRRWLREDGAEIAPGKLLVDRGYEADAVMSYCLRSEHKAIYFPAKGFYIKPTTTWASYFASKKDGETGFHWRIPPPENGVRYVLIDGDHWKEFIARALSLAKGSPGAWTICGTPDDLDLPLLADHLCAENRDLQQLGDSRKWHYTNPPGRDNHWWDCLVGCAVGASLLGIRAPGSEMAKRKRKLKVNFS